MKKTIIIAVTFLSFSTKAQNDIGIEVFHEGATFITAGYGLGNITQSAFKAASNSDINFQYKGVGPFFLKYEYAFAPKIGVGINASYAQATANYFYKDQTITDGSKLLEETLDWESYSILLRLNFHFGNHDKVDPYLGFGMGYRNAKQ